MARLGPRAWPIARGAGSVACMSLLAACTLSFDLASGDGGRRDARTGDALPFDGARPEGGQPEGNGPDAGEGGGPAEGGPDAPPPDAGDSGRTCDVAACPRVACVAPVCQADGTCGQMPSPMGTSCDDANPCTASSSCDGAGRCIGGVECPDDGDPCTDETCTAAGCVTRATSDGSACPGGVCCGGGCVDLGSDADHCGGCGGVCDTGLCVDGACVSCRFDSDCASATLDACVSSARCAEGRCLYAVRPTHCLIEGRCWVDGESAASNPCRFCSGGSTGWTDRSTCNDGLFCTDGDVCVMTGGFGRCDPGPMRSCDDGNPCTSDSCNEGSDRCDNVPLPDGTGCNDGNPCTATDRCQGGACTGAGSPCPPALACEISRCDTTSGACSVEYEMAGTACDDGDPCTTGTQCQATMSGATRCGGGGP
ncbi:MAG: hypothetical protein IT379_12730, partial [Deltaproteobacteria bacterium]|nr:hypothetical protein [Deltaproteobacteria bacterium]